MLTGTVCTSTDTTSDTTTETTNTSTDQDLGIVDTGTKTTSDAVTITNMDDPTFISTIACSNATELQLSNKALQKATDLKVKEFALRWSQHCAPITKWPLTLKTQ